MWEEARVPGEPTQDRRTCKLHTEGTQSAGGFEPRTLLLWGNSASHCTTVPPESAQVKGLLLSGQSPMHITSLDHVYSSPSSPWSKLDLHNDIWVAKPAQMEEKPAVCTALLFFHVSTCKRTSNSSQLSLHFHLTPSTDKRILGAVYLRTLSAALWDPTNQVYSCFFPKHGYRIQFPPLKHSNWTPGYVIPFFTCTWSHTGSSSIM